MSMSVNRVVGNLISILCLTVSPTAGVLADSKPSAILAQHSDLSCGPRISFDSVKVIDIRDLVKDKTRAVSYLSEKAPNHGLESPTPLILEKAHVEKRVRPQHLFRDAVQESIREAAVRGCDLAILLDLEIIEKVMYRPRVMDLKLDVSYVLVLFGSQVKNSARKNTSN